MLPHSFAFWQSVFQCRKTDFRFGRRLHFSFHIRGNSGESVLRIFPTSEQSALVRRQLLLCAALVNIDRSFSIHVSSSKKSNRHHDQVPPPNSNGGCPFEKHLKSSLLNWKRYNRKMNINTHSIWIVPQNVDEWETTCAICIDAIAIDDTWFQLKLVSGFSLARSPNWWSFCFNFWFWCGGQNFEPPLKVNRFEFERSLKAI